MNLFSSVLITIIILSYPLIIYLFYAAHNKKYNDKVKSIWLDIALFSSLYLFLKFEPFFLHSSVMIVNVPLIIAYVLRKRRTALIMSIFIVFYMMKSYNFNFFYLILEYSVYYFASLLKIDQRYQGFSYITVFTIFKVIVLAIYDYYINNTVISFFELMFIFNMYITANLILVMIKMGDTIMDYHMSARDLEEERQFKKTIFKITHEIKNPLAVCKGYLEMLDGTLEKTEKYVPIIKAEIDKSLILLQDFLSIDKIKINEELLDINMLIEEEREKIKGIAFDKKSDVEFEMVDDEIYIYGDYNRLSQVIVNLVKNGIEASKDNNKPLIKLKTESDADSAYITISDNGVGMNKEELEHLKKPFYTTKKNGTGLGVVLCDEIIKAHNGKLTYKSKKGEGTTVTIKIPLYQE